MSRFAWVTLATNDSYALGGLVLANSLKRVSTAHQLVILVTPTISEAMRHKLSAVFDLVQEVNVLDSQDTANLALLKRPELGVTFTKLHCWRLTQFEKCVFLDADTLVLQNSDELFDREELSAAPDVGWPDCFNTGVFVYRPSLDTYGKILEFAVTKGSFDGGDQGLLNSYFSDWATSDISKHLPFAYNTASTATYSYLPAFKQFGANTKILHFIGVVKPWLQNFDSQSQQVQTPAGYQHLSGFLQDWWNIFCESVHPNLDTTMPASLGEASSSSLIGFSEDANSEQYRMRDYDAALWKQVFQVPMSNSYSYTRSIHDPHQIHTDSECCHDQHHEDTSAQEIVFYDPWEEYLSRQEELIASRIDSENEEVVQQLPEPVSPKPEPLQAPKREPLQAPVSGSQEVEEQTPPEMPEPVIEETVPDVTPSNDVVVNSSLDPVEPSSDHCDCNGVADDADESVILEIPPIDAPIATSNHVPFIETNVTINANVDTMDEHEQVDVDSSKCKATELGTSKEEHGIVGALAQLKLGAPRTPEQLAYEDMMRRQSWESGQIDFAGRDAFANIWARIEQTISTNPMAEEARAPAPAATPAPAAAPIVPVMQKTPEDPANQCIDPVKQGETTTFDPTTNTTKVTTRVADGYKKVSTTVNPDGTKSMQTKYFSDPVEETEEEEIVETSSSEVSQSQKVQQTKGQLVSQQSISQQQSASQSVTQRRSSQTSVSSQQVQQVQSSQMRRSSQQTEVSETIVESESTESSNLMQQLQSQTLNTQALIDKAKNTTNTVAKTASDVVAAGGKATKVIEKFDGGRKEKITTVYPDGHQKYEEKLIYDTLEEEISEVTEETSELGSLKKVSAQSSKQDSRAVTSVSGNTITQQVMQVASTASREVCESREAADVTETTTTETLADGAVRTKVIERFDGGYKEKYTTKYKNGRQTYEEKTFYDTLKQSVSESASAQSATGTVTHTVGQNVVQNNLALTDNLNQLTQNNQQVTSKVTNTKEKKNTRIESTTTETLTDGAKRTKVVERFDGGRTDKFTTVYPDGRQAYEEKTFYDSVQEEFNETTTETTVSEDVKKVTAQNLQNNTNIVQSQQTEVTEETLVQQKTNKQLTNTNVKTVTDENTTTETLKDGGKRTKVIERFDGGYKEKYTTVYPDGRQAYEEKTFYDTVSEEITEVTQTTTTDSTQQISQPKAEKPKAIQPTTGVDTTTVDTSRNVTTTQKRTTTIVSTTTTTLEDGGEQTKVVEKFDGGYVEKYTTKYPDGREAYEEKTFFDTVQEEVTETTTETTENLKKVISDVKKQEVTETIEPKVTKPVESKPSEKPATDEVSPKAAKPEEGKPKDSKPSTVTDVTQVTTQKTTTIVSTTTTILQDGGEQTKVVEKFDGGYTEKYTTKYPDGRETYEEKTFFDTVQEEVTETTTETTQKVTKVTGNEGTPRGPEAIEKPEVKPKSVEKPATDETKPNVIKPGEVQPNVSKPEETKPEDKPKDKSTTVTDVTQVTTQKTTTIVSTTTTTLQDGGEQTKVVEKFEGGYTEKYTTKYPDGRETYEEKTFFDTVAEEITETTTETTQKVTQTSEEKKTVEGPAKPEDKPKNDKPSTEQVKPKDVKPDDVKPEESRPEKPAADEVKPQVTEPQTPQPTGNTPITDIMEVKNTTTQKRSTTVESSTTEILEDGGEQTKVVEKFDGGHTVKYTTKYPDGKETYEEKIFFDTVEEVTTETTTETTQKTTKTNEEKKVVEEPAKPKEDKPLVEEPKPEETKPVDGTKPNEQAPIESKPAVPKPSETTPQESKPQESKPQESKPQESKPQEPKPQESKPQESKPQESKPQEPKPQEPEAVTETTITDVTTTETTLSKNVTNISEENKPAPKEDKPQPEKTQPGTEEPQKAPSKPTKGEPQINQPDVQEPASKEPTSVIVTQETTVEETVTTTTQSGTESNESKPKAVKPTEAQPVEAKPVSEEPQSPAVLKQQVPQGGKPDEVKPVTEVTTVTDTSNVMKTNQNSKIVVQTSQTEVVEETITQQVNEQVQVKPTKPTDKKPQPGKPGVQVTEVTEQTTTDVTDTQNTRVTVVESTTTETLPDGGQRTKVVERFEGGYTEKYTTVYTDGRRAYEEKTFFDTVQVTDTTNVKKSTEVVETTTTETLPDGATKTVEIEKFDGGYKEKITTVYTDGRRAYSEKTFFDTVEITETTTDKTTTEKVANVNKQTQDTTSVDVNKQTQISDVTNTKNTKNTVVESTRTEKTSDNGVVTIVVERFDGGYTEKRTTVYPDGRQTYDEKTFFDTVATEVTETTVTTTKNQDLKAVNVKNTKQQLTDDQKATKTVKDVTSTTELSEVDTKNTTVESTRTEKTSDNGVVTIVIERFDGGYKEKRTTVYPDGRQTYDEKTFFDTVQTEVSETTTETTTTGKVVKNQDMKAVNVKNTTNKNSVTDQKVTKSVKDVTNTTEVSKIESTNTVKTTDGGERTTVVVKFDGGFKEQYTTVYPDGRKTYEEKVFYDTVQEEDTETTIETTDSGQKTQVKAKKLQQDAQATTTVVGGVVTQKVAQVTSAENKQVTNTKSVKGGTNVTSSVSEQSSTAVQNVSAKTTKGSTTSVTKQASQVSQSSTKVQSSIKSTKDAAVTAKVTDSAKSMIKKDVKAVTGATNTSVTSKTSKTATKDVKDLTSKTTSSGVIPAGGKTTKVIEKFDGGYKEIYTTVFPDGRQTTEEKTFFDEVEQKESKTTTEKLVGGRVTKTKDITSTRKVSATVTDKKNASTGTTSKVTSVKGDKPKLDANTTMVIEKFENGYKEIYTTTKPDGTQAIKVKTFYDEVEHERVEETKKRTTNDGVEKKTTTGETVVTETEKVKRKIMPKGVPVVEKSTTITDEKNEDRLGRKASMNTEGGTTTMVKEEFEGGYKEIYTTRFPDGRVKTETQTYYDSEEEEEIEEYEEYEEPEETEGPGSGSGAGGAGEDDGKPKVGAATGEDDGPDGPGKLKIPDFRTPEEEAALIEVNKLAASKLAMFQAQQEVVAPVKPKKVWKRPTPSSLDPAPITPVAPPRKKDVKSANMKR